MVKQLWINLPVKDVSQSTDFFKKIGFTFNDKMSRKDVNACMLVGDSKLVVMLFEQNIFSGFSKNVFTDTSKSTEVLFSIDAESREEVDQLAVKVKEAGGTIFGEPGENQGWMYGCGFCDPDGHRWNILYMDMSKMPK